MDGRLPIWALAGLAVFLVGFRGGLNAYDSGVIDVGYAGVVGADRILRGTSPYGTIPERTGDGCGPKFSDGNYSAYRQESGRCESFAVGIDTYGPVNYAAYVPAVAALGWTGRWDDLPAAHVTSLVFDALTGIGLLLLGRRLRGWRLGALLSCAWFAYPFTAYALQSNSNDMIVSALLVWALLAATHPLARGVFLGLAALAKFAPALLIPLWLRYPRRERPPSRSGRRARSPPAPAGLRARAAGCSATSGPGALAAFIGGLLCSALWRRSCSGRAGSTACATPTTRPSASSSTASPRSRSGTGTCPSTAPTSPICRRSSRSCASRSSAPRCWWRCCRGGSTWCAWRRSRARCWARFQIVLSHWSYLYLPWLFVPADRGPVRTQRRGLTAALAAACAAVALVAWFGLLSRPDPDFGPRRSATRRSTRTTRGCVSAASCRTATSSYEYPPLSLAARCRRRCCRRRTRPTTTAGSGASWRPCSRRGDGGHGRRAGRRGPRPRAPARGRAARRRRPGRRRAGGADPLRPVAVALVALALCGARGRTPPPLRRRAAGSAWRPSCGPRCCCPGRSRGRAPHGDLPRAAIAGAAAAALPFALALALSPAGLWDSLDLQAGRGLQIESTPAALLLGLAEIGIGGPYAAVTARTGQDLSEGWSGARADALDAARGGGGAGVRRPRLARRPAPGPRRGPLGGRALVAGRGRGRRRAGQGALAPVPALAAAAPAARARAARLVRLVAAAARAGAHAGGVPGALWLYVAFQRDAIALVLARDLLLVALLVLLAVPQPSARRRKRSALPCASASAAPSPWAARTSASTSP